MIYITSSAVVEDNEFTVKSVYVISDTEAWIITESAGWNPMKVHLSLERLESVLRSQRYYSSPLVYSPIRTHNDDDPKAFALFIRNKIKDGAGTKFQKKLFKTLSNFGQEWKK